MARKRKRKSEDPIKGDMTPMIDIVFQLLIFFMLTIQCKTLEGKLAAYLPKDVGVNKSEAEPKEKVEIRLKVDTVGTQLDAHTDEPWTGEGPFKYGPDRVITYSVGPKSTHSIDDLTRRLKELFRADPEQAVTIAPYQGTIYQDVIAVLDEAVDIGFSDITFMGAPPEQ